MSILSSEVRLARFESILPVFRIYWNRFVSENIESSIRSIDTNTHRFQGGPMTSLLLLLVSL